MFARFRFKVTVGKRQIVFDQKHRIDGDTFPYIDGIVGSRPFKRAVRVNETQRVVMKTRQSKSGRIGQGAPGGIAPEEFSVLRQKLAFTGIVGLLEFRIRVQPGPPVSRSRHETVAEVSDPCLRKSGKRRCFIDRSIAVDFALQIGVAHHRAAVCRQNFQHARKQLPAELLVLLQVMETVMKLAELADKAALEDIDHIAVFADQRSQLFYMAEHRFRRRPG